MAADVYFGDTETQLPDWRSFADDAGEDDDEPTENDRAAVAGVLGFDPAEMDDVAPAHAQPPSGFQARGNGLQGCIGHDPPRGK
jgi:hypothetical protein